MLESDPFSVVEGMIIAAFAIGAGTGLLLHPRRVPPGHQAHPERPGAVPRRGPAGREHHGHRLGLRHGDPPGRRRLRVRRGDRADPLHRRRARPAQGPPALPGGARPLGQADLHQQRGDLRQHHRHHQLRRRLVRPGGHPGERRHQGLRPGRQRQAHRPGGSAPGHAAAQGGVRHRRRRAGRPGPQGDPDRRPRRRLHPRPRTPTWKWTSRPWPGPAPSWAPAA